MVYTNPQVICSQCRKRTPFKQLVEGDTRSEPLGTGEGGRAAGQNFAYTSNLMEEAEAGLSGPSGRPFKSQCKGSSFIDQQMGALTSPSKPPAPKKPKKGGDGGSSSQAVETRVALSPGPDLKDPLIRSIDGNA